MQEEKERGIEPLKTNQYAELLTMPEYIKIADLKKINNRRITLELEEIKRIQAIIRQTDQEDKIGQVIKEQTNETETTKEIREEDIKKACPEMAYQFLERSK